MRGLASWRRVVAGVAVAVLVLAAQGPVVAPGVGAEEAASSTATAPPAPPGPAGTVDWNDLRQEIDGFGGSSAFGQAGRLMAYPKVERRQVLDLLFCREQLPAAAAPRDADGVPVCQTPGIGASMLRNQLRVCGVPGYACWRDQDVENVWLMNEAKSRGTTTFFSTPWTAPAYMKTNNSTVNGGSVKPEWYTPYANYLADYVLQMKEKGLAISAVSVSNEPEVSIGYESMNWTGEQFRVFVRDHVRPVFDLRGVTAKVMLPESVGWYETKAVPTLDDPVAEPRLDIVAAHGYDSDDPKPFATAQARSKRVWQTEDSDLGANDPSAANAAKWGAKIHDYLTKAEVNAWNYWWLMSEVKNGQTLINLDLPTSTFAVNKRMFALGNFSRFVRPGWRRIGVTAPTGSTALLSAYKDPVTGDFAVVAVNEGSTDQPLDLGLNGFAAESVVPYTTSASLDLAPASPITTPDGRLTTTVPAHSVVTYVGRGRSTSPLHVAAADTVAWSGIAGTTSVRVHNTGPAPVSATLDSIGAAGLSVEGGSRVVDVPAGGTATVPLSVRVADTVAPPSEHRLDVTAHVTGSPSTTVRGRSLVRNFGTTMSFCPNTPLEDVWLLRGDSVALTGWTLPGCNGNPRFTDAGNKLVYRFAVPADTASASLSLDIGNQFHVETSADGVTWRTVLRETDTTDRARTLGNRAVRTVDLADVRAGSRAVFVRMGDSQPADGWGGIWMNVRLDLQRASFSAPASVPEGSTFDLSIAGAPSGATFAFDCGGGFGAIGASPSTTCQAGDDGLLAVAARLRDAAGTTVEYRRSVRVDNAPTVVATPVVTSDRSGLFVTVAAAFADPIATDGPFTCTVDHGDGTAAVQGTVDGSTCRSAEHHYMGRGPFTVTVAVADAEGAAGSASSTYTPRT